MKRQRGVAKFLLIFCLVLAAGIVISRINGTRRMAPEGGMAVPLYLQTDYDETVCVIAGEDRSVKSSGCGATCVAMASAYYFGANDDRSPQALFEWAYDNGYYYGSGLGHDCMDALAGLCGIRSRWTGDTGEVKRALQDGHLVIAHMGPGEFTEEGHYILLRGLDENGLVLVNDPNSVERSGRSYELSLLQEQLKTPTGFMILSA